MLWGRLANKVFTSLLQYENNVYKYFLLLGSQYKCMFENYRSKCEIYDYHGCIKSRSPGIWLLAVWWTDISILKEGTAPSCVSELSRLLSSVCYYHSVHRTTHHHIPGDCILVTAHNYERDPAVNRI